MTIIFSTHDMNEAKKADKVAFMRGGQLLSSESPQKLMEIHQNESLSEIFCVLTRKKQNFVKMQKKFEDENLNFFGFHEKVSEKKSFEKKNFNALFYINWVTLKSSFL